ncbi:MAG: ATP synthase subunit I [Candidatus Brocadiae bacterium]|nr:ATP synthase subunit I [Candidatus Brocadiia bacterium]
MIDPQLRRYYLTAAGIGLLSTAASLPFGDAAVTLGVAGGVLVSAVPFVTWHIIVAGLNGRSRTGKALVTGLVLVKYAAVAGVVWGLFRWKLVHEVSFGLGLVAGSMAVFGIVVRGAEK